MGEQLYICNNANHCGSDGCPGKFEPRTMADINKGSGALKTGDPCARGFVCKPIPYKEEPMEEIKYKVIKPFTKYDYIVAHQKKYGWTSFKESCAEFQKDMERWINEFAEPGDIKHLGGYSDNFYKHGVMFGFLEKVEPEVFYKVGDHFKDKNGKKSILIGSCNCTFTVAMYYPDSRTFGQVHCFNNKQSNISKYEFDKIFPGFTKI